MIYESGSILLRRGSWEEARVGSSYQQPTVPLIPGVYDVHWRHFQGSTVPANQDGRFRRGLVVDGAPRVINVPSVQVSGDIRVNGQPPPVLVQDFARLWLETPDGANRMLLGATLYGSFGLRVLPGLYDVIYEHAAGDLLPSNPRATIERNWRVAAQPIRTIDIPSGAYEGTFLLNGGGPANARLELYRDGNSLLLPETSEGAIERVTMEGRFDVFYHYVGGPGLPRNVFMPFACWNLVR